MTIDFQDGSGDRWAQWLGRIVSESLDENADPGSVVEGSHGAAGARGSLHTHGTGWT